VWGETEFVYNGKAQKPKAPTVVTGTGETAIASVSAEGNVNVGSYEATAKIEGNENYVISEIRSKVEYTIVAMPIEIDWRNLVLTYNGAKQVPTARAIGSLPTEVEFIVEGEGECISVGEYEAVVSTQDSNYVITNSSTTYNIVAKEMIVKWDNTELEYNGEIQKPSASIDTSEVSGEECVIIVDATGRESGSYTATARTYNKNFALKEASTAYTIISRKVKVSWDTSRPLYYNGQAQAPIVIVNTGIIGKSCEVTILNKGTNAGEYTATVTTSDSNFQLEGETSKTYTINPKELTVDWSNLTLMYNGQEQGPIGRVETGIVGQSNDIVEIRGKATNVGEHTATAVSKNANYTFKNNTEKYTIQQKQIYVVWSNTKLT
jgi:hypothetical protein